MIGLVLKILLIAILCQKGVDIYIYIKFLLIIIIIFFNFRWCSGLLPVVAAVPAFFDDFAVFGCING